MRYSPRPLCIFAVLATLGASCSAAANEVKAVVELFTSQGCSSCPKADKLLGQLAEDRRLVALSLSVDYWDYLGWRDTLALHVHTLRQKSYAISRGDRQVYTPQVVINGASEAIGSDRYAIERLVSGIDAKSKLFVPVTMKRNGSQIEIEVGSGTGPPAAIWIVGVAKKSPVVIERGENRGKTITYHNVVRGWQRLADWKGSAVHASLAVEELARHGADAAAVLVQSGSVESPGPICGAAMISLH